MAPSSHCFGRRSDRDGSIGACRDRADPASSTPGTSALTATTPPLKAEQLGLLPLTPALRSSPNQAETDPAVIADGAIHSPSAICRRLRRALRRDARVPWTNGGTSAATIHPASLPLCGSEHPGHHGLRRRGHAATASTVLVVVATTTSPRLDSRLLQLGRCADRRSLTIHVVHLTAPTTGRSTRCHAAMGAFRTCTNLAGTGARLVCRLLLPGDGALPSPCAADDCRDRYRWDGTGADGNDVHAGGWPNRWAGLYRRSWYSVSADGARICLINRAGTTDQHPLRPPDSSAYATGAHDAICAVQLDVAWK
jgi:hypothetical protein